MSARREVRLRKEFLYKKQQAVQEVQRGDKKRKLRDALDEGKSIPTEIVGEARELQHELENDLLPERSSVDDEYAQLGLREPKVCVTTSRDPSSRLKQFAKYASLSS